MLSSSLRQRLGDLIRRGGLATGESRNGSGSVGGIDRCGGAGYSNGHEAVGLQRPEPRIVRAGIEEILPGGVLEGPYGPVFLHERLYSEIGERPGPVLEQFAALCGVETEPPRRRGRRVAPLDLPAMAAQADWPERGLFRRFGYRRMLFLDLETCGVWGGPVFLAGLCLVSEGDLVFRQLFARDYAEEKALLHELGRIVEAGDFLVTYNGKAFDVPFLRDRAVHHRMRLALDRPHLDLLWLARRRWRGVLPDCKLKTLEWHVLRKRRAGDVYGFEIPGLYHDYVQNGEPHRLIPVFHHNLLDVLAMVELLGPIFDAETEIY